MHKVVECWSQVWCEPSEIAGPPELNVGTVTMGVRCLTTSPPSVWHHRLHTAPGDANGGPVSSLVLPSNHIPLEIACPEVHVCLCPASHCD